MDLYNIFKAMSDHMVDEVQLKAHKDGTLSASAETVRNGNRISEIRWFTLNSGVPNSDIFSMIERVGAREPDILEKINKVVRKNIVHGVLDREPNLLILGPEEYRDFLTALPLHEWSIAAIKDVAGKLKYKGMRIVQSKEPGITVARENPK